MEGDNEHGGASGIGVGAEQHQSGNVPHDLANGGGMTQGPASAPRVEPANLPPDEPAAAKEPVVEHTIDPEVKAWVRKELVMFQEGHSEKTRERRNP